MSLIRLTLLILLLLMCLSLIRWQIRPDTPVTQTHATALERIRKQAELTVMSVEHALIVTRDLRGWTGGVQTCVIAVGQIQLGSDLNRAVFTQVDEANQVATLQLPDPQVRHVRMNMDRMQVYAVDRQGMWKLLPFATREKDVIMDAMQEAQVQLAKSITQDHVEQAREHTQTVIQQLLKPTGWEVDIVWEPPER